MNRRPLMFLNLCFFEKIPLESYFIDRKPFEGTSIDAGPLEKSSMDKVHFEGFF